MFCLLLETGTRNIWYQIAWDRCVRNQYQLSGSCFWHRFLVTVSWALVYYTESDRKLTKKMN